jgi:hypothetical protein
MEVGVMALVVATWPDGTFSLLKMDRGFTIVEVLEALDQETSELPKEVYEVCHDGDGMHITVDKGQFRTIVKGELISRGPPIVRAIAGKIRMIYRRHEWKEN